MRSSRRAACRASLPVPACKHSLHAFKPARGMPRKLACSGLQAQLAVVQAGARHAAQACLFRPASTACMRSSRRAACRASLPVPACKHSLHAFKPARGMPRKLAGFHPQ